MGIKATYDIHRKTAIEILSKVDDFPKTYSNERLAFLLEERFPEESHFRNYAVFDDDDEISGRTIEHPQEFFNPAY
jgi:hypothetical protein